MSFWSPRSVIEDRLRHRVIVTLKSGEAFRGILTEHDERALVLRETFAAGGSQETIPVDGELIVLWSDVAYLQKP